jgi:hypothetical protein
VPFLSLEFNLEALRKLAERGLSKEDVLSLFRADQVVWTANPTRVPSTVVTSSARRQMAG